MVPVSGGEHGSNLVVGRAPVVNDENAIIGFLVNKIRDLLARLSGIPIIDWNENFERIRNIARLFDPAVFCRAVFQCCNEKFGDDKYFWFLAMRLLLPREYYLAVMIFKFFSNQDHTQVKDVICSLKSPEIRQIKNIYPSLFQSQLEVHIETHTWGNDTKLLLRHTSDPRGNASVGEEQLTDTVRYLHENVQGTRYFTQRAIMDRVYGLNEEDLRIAVDQYRTQYGKPLAEDLTRAGSGPFKHGLLTKIRCAVDRPEFLAGKLYEALGEILDSDEEKMDIDHDVHYETIVRVITTVTVEERMMIKEKYRLKSDSTLEKDISDAFKNRLDYSRLILMILNASAPN